jgi:hypothetical protein
LEAEVGIEQVSQLSKSPPKSFGSGNFSKCCTDKETNIDKCLNQANNAQQTPTHANTFSARFSTRCSGLVDDLRCRKRLGGLLRYYYLDAA